MSRSFLYELFFSKFVKIEIVAFRLSVGDLKNEDRPNSHNTHDNLQQLFQSSYGNYVGSDFDAESVINVELVDLSLIHISEPTRPY